MIIAGEQFAGRGRNARQWSSPPGKGIYATTLLTCPAETLSLVPLEMANVVASYLREVFGIDARIKWPNDILAGGRKIAGILIEARVVEERAFLLIGTGINVEPVTDDLRPNAVAISEVTPREFRGLRRARRRTLGATARSRARPRRVARPHRPSQRRPHRLRRRRAHRERHMEWDRRARARDAARRRQRRGGERGGVDFDVGHRAQGTGHRWLPSDARAFARTPPVTRHLCPVPFEGTALAPARYSPHDDHVRRLRRNAVHPAAPARSCRRMPSL